MNFTTYLARATCLTVGASLAAVGMYASYDAASQSGSRYLMIAAPLVALAAPLTMVFGEIAIEARQYIKALALLAVFGLTAATVFYTAAERNHAGRAVGEAQRAAYRTAVDRAASYLKDAEAVAKVATAAANKVRGKTTTKAIATLDSEIAAFARVEVAKQELAKADAIAVTESDIKQPDWLLPASVDIANMVLIWVGFGLGRIERKPAAPVPAMPAAPAAPAETDITETAEFQAALKKEIKRRGIRKGQETKRRNKALREKARKTGPRLATQN